MATLTKDEQIQVLDGILDDIEHFEDLATPNDEGNEAFRTAVRAKLLQRDNFLRSKIPPAYRNGEPLEPDDDDPTLKEKLGHPE